MKHVVSGCSELAKKQYVIRHDKMGTRIHWELCQKIEIQCKDKWFNHIPNAVCSSKDGKVELYWNRKIEVGKALEHNKPDLVIVDNVIKKWTLIDFSVPWDGNVKIKCVTP